jgi:hypothetical protein
MTTKFSDLGIKTVTSHFIGDKIKISKVLNREIKVLDYTVKPSNFKGNCLQIQIELNGTKHVVFTGSTILIDTIEKIPKSAFPFLTTIVEESEHYEFT